jgi:hypothetical protein
MSANSAVTVLRSPSVSAAEDSAALKLIEAGVLALADWLEAVAPAAPSSAVAHCPQKRAAGEFSNPHFAQRRLNGAAHCSQNLSPSGFSAPQLEQRISVAGFAPILENANLSEPPISFF